jgi:hypothetical protein
VRATQHLVGGTARRTWWIRTACGIASCAALIAAINPAAGYAAAKTPSVKLGSNTTAICSETSCPNPSPGNDIVATVKLGQNFTKAGLQVTQICLNFTFDEADPLDPFGALTVVDIGGFVGEQVPLFSRQLCVEDPLALEQFQDGKATLDIYSEVGGFTVADLTVTYIASPIG